MEKAQFQSFNYVVSPDSFNKTYRQVKVFYIYQYKNYVKTLLIKKNPNRKGQQYYIDQAEQIIRKMVSSGKLMKYTKKKDKKKRFLLILIPFLSLGAIAGITVGTYFALNQTVITPEPGPEPPDPPVPPTPYGDDYFSFTCLSDTAKLCKITNNAYPIDLEYSFDKTNWKEAELGHEIEASHGFYAYNYTLEKNQTIYFRGDNPNGLRYSANIFLFTHDENTQSMYVEPNGDLSISGNILSLIYKNSFKSKNANLPSSCFNGLFNPNANLIDASQLELPSETSESCYSHMFYGCNRLTKAPVLPATNLSDSCYYSMFNRCEALNVAPELPATNLSDSCYKEMFKECKSLTKAPVLPATNLPLYSGCYQDMFSLCENLNYLKVKFGTRNSTDWPEGENTTGWLSDAGSKQAKKVFVWEGATSGPTSRGANTIPEDWFVQSTWDYLNFTCVDSNGTTLVKDFDGATPEPSLEYSFDKENWQEVEKGSRREFHLEYNQQIFFRGNNPNGVNKDKNSGLKFVNLSTTQRGDLVVAGNIMSLISDEFVKITVPPCDCCFASLFSSNEDLVDASGLILPTDVSQYCYDHMFAFCSHLTKAPELPATTLEEGCYEYMFHYCNNLIQAPKLPATTLVDYCYYYMFTNCVNLPSLNVGFKPTGSGEGTWPNPDATYYWLTDAGKNVENPNFSWEGPNDWKKGDESARNGSTIPINWGVENSEDYFCFTCTSNTASFMALIITDVGEIPTISLEYSNDKENWQDVAFSDPETVEGYDRYSHAFNLYKNDTLYFRGDNPNGLNDYDPMIPYGLHFSASSYQTQDGSLTVSGNVMSLLQKEDFTAMTELPDDNGTFSYLFTGNYDLVDASQLRLPLKLRKYCYDAMFLNCANLITAPSLPATMLAGNCYEYMFSGCESLTAAPELPATTLALFCYNCMFSRCSKLQYLKVGFGTPESQEWPVTTNYTLQWLLDAGTEASNKIFIWNGSNEGPEERTHSTVPEGWTINPASA